MVLENVTVSRSRLSEFRARLESVRTVAPFGINFVVNDERHCKDLNTPPPLPRRPAPPLLLLPEEPAIAGPALTRPLLASLRDWVTDMRQTGGFP